MVSKICQKHVSSFGMKVELSLTGYKILYMKRSSQSITDGTAHWSYGHLRLIFLQSTQDTNQPARSTKWKVTHTLPKKVPIETNGFSQTYTK